MLDYRKVLDNWIGFISGVWGGGLGFSANIPWTSDLLKILFGAFTAAVAGFAGIGGKYFFVYLHRRAHKASLKKQRYAKQIKE